MRKTHLAACLFLTACAAPGILGHEDPETTHVRCADGSTCPLGYECPVATGGRCESDDAPGYSWGPENIGKRRVRDAGAD
jgi:hypothetical protein